MDLLSRNRLEKEFNGGNLPQGLDGFYKGTLVGLLPQNFFEFLALLLSKFYIPWKGKYFYADTKTGNNLLPFSIQPVVAVKYGKESILKKDREGFHAFTFKTSSEKGLENNLQVLRLNYNISENPEFVREVVDELICVGSKEYLGKAYFKKNESVRLIAYFRLQKV